MGKELRILILEDVPTDAELMERELRKEKLVFVARRAVTEEAFVKELSDFSPDLILADYNLPSFDGISALAIAQKTCSDVPFIFVSGAIGEELAIETLKMGASDYILKDRLSRLGPAVRRALRELKERTARRRAEEALRKSESRYRIMTENVTDVIWTTDMNLRFTYISPSITRMLGYTVEEVANQMIAKVLTPASIEVATKAFAQELAKENMEHKDLTRSWTLELEFSRKDGSIVWTESKVTFLRDSDARPVRILGVARDITDRKRAEEALKQSRDKLRRTFEETVNVLASAVEIKDPYTAGHQQRVTKLACAIGKEIGFPEEQSEGLRLAATIHDIGKIYVPSEILSKPGQLARTEYDLVKTHPLAGYQILNGIEFPWPVAQIVLQHHERLDGSGYPQGISGDAIILEARVLAVADVVEAMASHRPYRAAHGAGGALEEILRHKGILYDPEVADACLRLFYDKGFKFE